MQQGIVNEAVVDRFFNPLPVFFVQLSRDFHVNPKIIHSRWIFELLSGNADERAFHGQLILFQILSRIKSRAGAK